MEYLDKNPHRATTAFGIWQEMATPSISRYLAAMGWDFVVLDMQHGAMAIETAYQCVHVLRAAGVRPWIRVPIADHAGIQRALDLGAQTVVVPMVNSRDQAFAAAQAAKYPPLGERSVGGDFAVHQGEDYPERANRETSLLIQIEHVDALQAIEDIMSVPGVDGCFVGPTDLALSMGLSRGDFATDARHRQAIDVILSTSMASHKIACCNSYSLADASRLLNADWTCVTFRSDVDLLMQAGAELLARLRKLPGNANRTAGQATIKGPATT